MVDIGVSLPAMPAQKTKKTKKTKAKSTLVGEFRGADGSTATLAEVRLRTRTERRWLISAPRTRGRGRHPLTGDDLIMAGETPRVLRMVVWLREAVSGFGNMVKLPTLTVLGRDAGMRHDHARAALLRLEALHCIRIVRRDGRETRDVIVSPALFWYGALDAWETAMRRAERGDADADLQPGEDARGWTWLPPEDVWRELQTRRKWTPSASSQKE